MIPNYIYNPNYKVSARIIKDCFPFILGPITETINCSIITNTFPTTWKTAEVIPIHKDRDHEEAANNRPLSLLPVVSKVCERILLEQVIAYCLRNTSYCDLFWQASKAIDHREGLGYHS